MGAERAFMKLKIKELPVTERPYEKLELYGEKMLSNSELLAIIIKNGTKEHTAIDISNMILSKINNNLKELQDITLAEFMNIQGIGKVKAIELKAVCELTKRMSRPINDTKIQIKNTKDVANVFMDELKFEKREVVKLVLLNTRNIIIKIVDISYGGTTSAQVNPKDILAEAIKIGAPKFILIHNHPSGDPEPSFADFEITERIEKASKIMGIEFIDHIVIGDGGYESIFLKRGVNNV
ncbi:MAG: DNA repair protein RadC [Clostridia bacterium]|nr:DNA repair protein RadC [Clostridia bacterium]